jgi:hypothetical protein
MTTENYFVKHLTPAIGKRVKEIRALTYEEIQDFCWYDNESAVVIIFEDGTAWIPMQDPEGNGPGFITVATTVSR